MRRGEPLTPGDRGLLSLADGDAGRVSLDGGGGSSGLGDCRCECREGVTVLAMVERRGRFNLSVAIPRSALKGPTSDQCNIE